MSLRVSLTLALVSCCKSPSAVDSQEAPSKHSPAVPSKPAQQAAAELLVGKWLMISEEAADNQGGFFEQKRRVFHFAPDKSFRVENFVSTLAGKFSVAGPQLTLHAQDRLRLVELVSVTAERLVLIEDLPEIYLREGPPRRVRNTYRRVRESEFGPMMGDSVQRSEAAAGEYSASYEYSMSKLPTMEITSDRRISGRGKLLLSADGSAESCFGVHSNRSRSESKYSSDDGKHHSREEHHYWLAGMRGTWQSDEGKLRVRMDRSWRDSCDTGVGPGEISGALDLVCEALASNNKLPTTILACRMIQGPTPLNEISINPADTERSGPYTMQVVPRGHIATEQGSPWLFLSSMGLAVQSEDGRRSDSPVVVFSSPALPFTERAFIEKKK